MVLEELYEIIKSRKNTGQDGSYTKYLFEKGTDKILKKVGEECTEVIIASKGSHKKEIVNEVCDLALTASESILKREVKYEDNQKLLDDFINDLEKK